MVKTIIQFNKSDINRLNYLFKTSFSRAVSPHRIFIRKNIIHDPNSEQFVWHPDPNFNPWVIYTYDDNRKIGEIYYHPDFQKDSLLFYYSLKFKEPVQQLIEIIKIRMNEHGISIIVDNIELTDSQELIQDMPKRTGHPGLTMDEWLERLEKAKEAEELKKSNPKKTYKQICLEIKWPWGKNPKTKVKLLYEARMKLERLQSFDPDGFLIELSKRKKY